jgi:RHS repeat-associated protein
MVYNKADQLTSWPGMHSYQYDSAGNLQTVTGSGAASYIYTPAGLLDTASYNGRSIKNIWDAAAHRVQFVATSGTHTFVYDITAGIPAVIQEDGVYYVREPGGLLIARVSGTDMSYYHFDSLGSTRLLTDADGDVTDKYAYDAYGSLISHDELAGSVDQPYQYVGQLGYYAHWQEPEFGLMQLGVRFYDAAMGRFTQHGSPYTYSASNPVSIASADGTATVPDLTNPPVKGIPRLPTPRVPKPPVPTPTPTPEPPVKPSIGWGAIGRVCGFALFFLLNPSPVDVGGDLKSSPSLREFYREACVADCDDQNGNDREYCKNRYPGNTTQQKRLRQLCYEEANKKLCECHDDCTRKYPY